ncbi:carbohydrate ABC transporter permease [Paenibacillus hemerocallicola]|jgi:putative aldouronate transport system permease protein|uniref:Carbohydrate ABC transporter permease n=1 Tax=Paenibacillus hemerocallicola TaxID=1172614 RepID=A0A5C4T368_9BACL|nr:carbohydrate ABC transporter permease [Paenibacillus hemerocallicola]TNJ63255.1 carbohydrate ABC transporter permease [Paenibacillus hemerocallicola]
MKPSRGDRMMQASIYALLAAFGAATLYPFWNALVISFNTGADTALGGLTVWPRQFTLENYAIVFQDKRLSNAFLVSATRTVVGTALSIWFTAMFGYGMSVRGLIGKKGYMVFCIVTLYFSGGLIPFFLLNRELGMMNSFWVMIVPSLISVWNMIVFRTFFAALPAGLEESAKIDGCGHFGIFFKIVAPLSGPVIATLSLFTAVYHWNDWFTAGIFISTPELLPIQTVLQQIMNSNIMSEQLMQTNAAAQEHMARMAGVTTKSLTMATMMVATIPVVLVYPFLQKYFVKGVLVGSLKE